MRMKRFARRLPQKTFMLLLLLTENTRHFTAATVHRLLRPIAIINNEIITLDNLLHLLLLLFLRDAVSDGGWHQSDILRGGGHGGTDGRFAYPSSIAAAAADAVGVGTVVGKESHGRSYAKEDYGMPRVVESPVLLDLDYFL